MTTIPDEPVGWIHRSYVLHEQKRTREAWDLLLPAAKKFPEDFTIPYNLACYAIRHPPQPCKLEIQRQPRHTQRREGRGED